jgi:hypothetical protein
VSPPQVTELKCAQKERRTCMCEEWVSVCWRLVVAVATTVQGERWYSHETSAWVCECVSVWVKEVRATLQINNTCIVCDRVWQSCNNIDRCNVWMSVWIIACWWAWWLKPQNHSQCVSMHIRPWPFCLVVLTPLCLLVVGLVVDHFNCTN